MTIEQNKISYVENIKSQVLNNVKDSEDILVNPKKTLLLVVDMVNDSNREEGFWEKVEVISPWLYL